MELLQGENHVAHNFTSHVTKLCMKHKFSNTGHYFVECWKIRPVKPDCKNMLACQQSDHGCAYECVCVCGPKWTFEWCRVQLQTQTVMTNIGKLLSMTYWKVILISTVDETSYEWGYSRGRRTWRSTCCPSSNKHRTVYVRQPRSLREEGKGRNARARARLCLHRERTAFLGRGGIIPQNSSIFP